MSFRCCVLSRVSIACRPWFIGLIAAVTFGGQARAADWSVSGFGTLGATVQSGGDGLQFRRNSAQQGNNSDVSATQDSRLGLQLNWNPSPSWEAAVQGVASQHPSGTPVLESVEWAYFGYLPLPNTRIRLGRISPDIFLFADSRNVGFALPWARPPVDFYGFAPMTSVDGADLEQRWSDGDVSTRVRFSVGKFDATAVDGDGNRVPIQGRDVFAFSVTHEDGGLLLKASALRSRLRFDAGPQAQQLLQGLQQLALLPVPGIGSAVSELSQNLWTGGSASYFALGAQYDSGPWSFVTEGSMLLVPGSPLNARRGYISISYRHRDMTFYGLTSRVLPDRSAAMAPDLVPSLTPLLGAAQAQGAQQLVDGAAQAATGYRFDQSTMGVGLRWDGTPNVALKLQLDRFDVRPGGSAGWRYGNGSLGHGELTSILVDFVWGQ